MDDVPKWDQGLDSLAEIYTQKLSSHVLCMQSRSQGGFNSQGLTSRDKKYSSVTPKVDTDLSPMDITVPESGIKDVKFIINCIHLVKIHNLTLHPVNVPLFLTGYGLRKTCIVLPHKSSGNCAAWRQLKLLWNTVMEFFPLNSILYPSSIL